MWHCRGDGQPWDSDQVFIHYQDFDNAIVILGNSDIEFCKKKVGLDPGNVDISHIFNMGRGGGGYSYIWAL